MPQSAQFSRLENAVKIDDVTLGATALFSFTAIPQGFRHLQIVAYVRGAQAATDNSWRYRFNGDSGGNYDYNYVNNRNVTLTPVVGAAQVTGQGGLVTLDSAPANRFTVINMWIPAYSQTTNHKSTVHTSAGVAGTTAADMFCSWGGGTWRSTAAITSILLWHGNGAGELATGSILTLYGLM